MDDVGGYQSIDQEERVIQICTEEPLDARNSKHRLSRISYTTFLAVCAATLLITAALLITVRGTDAYNNLLFGSQPGEEMEPVYDFIVVGGGPAGSILTRKLVDRGVSVLLLEAGIATQHSLGGKDYFGGPVTRFDIPLLWSAIPQFPAFSWPIVGGLIAKGLGGCGIHNAMLYVRALESDFIKWNVTGWTWAEAFEIYKTLENYVSASNTTAVPDYHGTTGPIHTTAADYIDQLAPLFISSAVQDGIPSTSDFNNPDNGRVGVGYYNFNIYKGIRDGAAKAMLGPLINDPEAHKNFKLSLQSTAKKVLLEEYDGEIFATGIEYVDAHGATKTAKLRNPCKMKDQKSCKRGSEVVITSGSLNTPKLLMTSGIGDPVELMQAGIRTLVSSPNVGKNLQDHPAVGFIVELDPSVTASYPKTYDLANLWATYITTVESETVDLSQYGVLGTSGISAGAFLCSPFSINGVPDIQLTVFPTVSEPHLITEAASKNATPQDIIEQRNLMLVTIALLEPHARRQVMVNSTNPIDYPPILSLPPERSRYLHDSDVDRIAWGVTRVREIFTVPPLSELTGAEVSPGSSITGSALSKWILDNAYANSHWVGTASMGDDPSHVVDAELRVNGVKNLRVADASIIPYIPNGNVHATVLMVAYKAAEMIMSSFFGSMKSRN